MSKALALLIAGYTLQEAAQLAGWPAGPLRQLATSQKGWLIDQNGRIYDPSQPRYRPKAPDCVPLAHIKWAADLKDSGSIPPPTKTTSRTTRSGTKPMTDTPLDNARAIGMLCDGKTAQEVVEQTGLTLGRVVQIARRQGWTIHPTTKLAIDPLEDGNKPVLPPEIEALLKAAETTTAAAAKPRDAAPMQAATQSSVDQLLADARGCDDRRVQAALRRAEAAIDKLRESYQEAADRIEAARQAEAERQKALAEVAELERKLAAAKARAKKTGAQSGRTTTPATAKTTDSERYTNAEIRAWAAANGIPCSPRGRIPWEIRDQYRAATER